MNLLKKIAIVGLSILIGTPIYGVDFDTALQKLKKSNTLIAQRSLRTKQHFKADADSNNPLYAFTWGTINHEDGYTWYYTQTFEERGYFFGASDITIYNNNFNEICTLHIDVPEGLNVNDIMPVDFITSQFFDTDASSYELPVFVHAVDNGKQYNYVYVYNLDGEIIQEYNSRSMIKYTASDDYTRVFLVNEEDGYMNIDILKAAENNNRPTIEHTFTINQELLYYSSGPALNYYTLDNEPYYCISHFEKPCMDGIDLDSSIPTQTPDNYLLIKTYNKNYEMVDSLRVSLAASDAEATYGFASLGLLSYNDVRLGEFTNDNQRNYIVTHYDYYALSDDFLYHFRVYDQEGNLVNTIVEKTTNWFALSDVDGFEEQMVFLKTNDAGEQSLEMVNIPSCEVAAVFPTVIDGYQISTTLDRYPVGDDYQYVIALGQASENADGDAIARIGWYKKDASVDRYVEFNIGKNAEGFTPYISSYVLDPYLFNTDDKREYFYLAMNKRTDGSDVLDKTLYLADEDGKVLRIIKPDEGDEVEFSSGDVFDYNTDSPRMLLSFYNGDKDAFEIQFYNLPFDKFTSGGDGTVENPYVITTPGELAQMYSEPAAHYILGNDIDMSTYTFPYYGAKEFTGTFDGAGYVISNLVLDNGGLFATTNGATIKNLQIQSPTFNAGNVDCGILADRTYNTTVENVHIYDAVVDGVDNTDTYVGGLVGVAEKTTIQVASMVDASVNCYVSDWGGIVGNAIACEIKAVVSGGSVSAGLVVGGIAAVADNETHITDCHTLWDICATDIIGGIVAHSKRAIISSCYTDCVYNALIEAPDAIIGGIVGELDSDNIKDLVIVVSSCVTTSGSIVGNLSEHDFYVLSNYSGSENVKDGEYKPVEDMNRAFFEELGYDYGNTVDAPWMGEGLPLLYFENDHQSVTSVSRENSTICYDGTSVSVAKASSIALYNVQGQLVATTHSEELNVADVAAGVYVVVAVDSNDDRQSRKIVVK